MKNSTLFPELRTTFQKIKSDIPAGNQWEKFIDSINSGSHTILTTSVSQQIFRYVFAAVYGLGTPGCIFIPDSTIVVSNYAHLFKTVPEMNESVILLRNKKNIHTFIKTKAASVNSKILVLPLNSLCDFEIRKWWNSVSWKFCFFDRLDRLFVQHEPFSRLLPVLKYIKRSCSDTQYLIWLSFPNASFQELINMYTGITDWQMLCFGFSLPNCHLMVKKGANKISSIIKIIYRTNKPCVVFAQLRKDIQKIIVALEKEGIPAGSITAGLDADIRRRILKEFRKGTLQVLVLTPALYYILQNSPVDIILHYTMPVSIDQYYRELSIVHQTKKPLYAILFYHPNDRETIEYFINSSQLTKNELESIRTVMKKIVNENKENKLPVISIDRFTTLLTPFSLHTKTVTVLKLVGSLGFITYKNPLVSTTKIKFQTSLFNFPDEIKKNLQNIRQYAYSQLDTIEDYIFTNQCRQSFLLSSLQVSEAPDYCEKCDNCLRLEKQIGLKKYDRDLVITILKCVAETREKFGTTTIVSILKGGKGKQIRQFNLDNTSGYGKLQEMDTTFLKEMLQNLMRDGYLSVRKGLYPTLELTEWGRQALVGEEIHEIRLPKLLDQSFSESFDTLLFDELRRVRQNLAKRYNVATFEILTDKILQRLAALQPESEAELDRIRGFGKIKKEKFGKDFTEVIREFRNKAGLKKK